MSDPQAIDAWAQLPLGPNDTPPEVRNLFEYSGTAEVLDTGVDPDRVIEQMDQAGVATLMVCAWHRPGQVLMSNEQVAELASRYPGRFVGVATVDLEHPMKAVRELDRTVGEYGFKALRVVPWLWKLPPNDPHYWPLYVRCIEYDIPFCTQVGHTGPLMPSEPGRPVPYLDEVALKFPELKIVAGHIGYPWTDEMIGVAWKHKNVYIDTSAWAPKYYPRQLLHFMSTYGRGKVMFGTNFPQLSFKQCIEQAKKLGLSEEAQAEFFRGAAQRVFKL